MEKTSKETEESSNTKISDIDAPPEFTGFDTEYYDYFYNNVDSTKHTDKEPN